MRLGVAAIVLTLGTAACSAGGEAPAQAAGARAGGPPAVPVATAKVEQKTMPLALTVIGTAEAYSNVAVHAQITGSLTSVNFKEGDDVAKDQVLFTLDRRPLEAALQQAEATLARDRAQAAQAKSTAARYQDLENRGIATKEQAEQSRSSAVALDATLEADVAAIENARVQLQYATIKAPLAGRTGALIVHEGNLVRANDVTAMVVINQVAPIRRATPGTEAVSCAGHGPRGSRRAWGEDPVEREHHLYRQRRRFDDRSDQDQGVVPEHRPSAVARTIRERDGDTEHRPQRDRRPDRRRPERSAGELCLRREAGHDR
jgi:multidrug efflux pump subunit AcrA (membrane-fusion protein)